MDPAYARVYELLCRSAVCVCDVCVCVLAPRHAQLWLIVLVLFIHVETILSREEKEEELNRARP